MNCQNKIEQALKKTPGVESAKVRYQKGTADIAFDLDWVTLEELQQVIRRAGYEILLEPSVRKPDFGRTATLLILIFFLYRMLQHSGILNLLVPSELADTGMGYGMLFLIGILTSVHCIAMCGGINLSQCIPKSAGNEDSRFGAFRSAVLYNLGRVISYTGIGFLLGLLGMLVGETTGAGISPFFQGILKMIAGVFMVIMGINMLGIFPWLRRFQLQLPRFLVRNVNQKKAKSSQPFVIDQDRKEVCKQGKPVALTPIEWKLLTALTRYPQKVFTREDLIELAFGLDFSGYDRVIDTHVKNLRKKLEDDPKQPVYICTVHGMGYKFGGFRE